MIVSYCTGIGGLDLAVERVFGAVTEHTFEVDRHADTVIAARFPDAARWGDLSGDDTAGIQAGDGAVVTAGFPCQDISLAGKGVGLDGARSGLWFTILGHVETVGPKWVAVENVPALAKRGLDVVLEGLTDAGYGGAWCYWRAGYRSKNRQRFPHVNAPHQRKRLFILARRGHEWGTESQAGIGRFRQVEAAFADPTGDVDTLFPTPAASNYGYQQGGAAGRVGPERYGLGSIDKLLPTPAATGKWGDYAAAIARWETQLGRPAPEPVTPEGKLNPVFVEWTMGFPAGWVTDLDIPRAQQLKMLGNAVVPLQAETALTYLKTRITQAARMNG